MFSFKLEEWDLGFEALPWSGGQGGDYRGFPNLGVPCLGGPIIRIIVYWGRLILGDYRLPYSRSCFHWCEGRPGEGLLPAA